MTKVAKVRYEDLKVLVLAEGSDESPALLFFGACAASRNRATVHQTQST